MQRIQFNLKYVYPLRRNVAFELVVYHNMTILCVFAVKKSYQKTTTFNESQIKYLHTMQKYMLLYMDNVVDSNEKQIVISENITTQWAQKMENVAGDMRNSSELSLKFIRVVHFVVRTIQLCLIQNGQEIFDFVNYLRNFVLGWEWTGLNFDVLFASEQAQILNASNTVDAP